MDHFDRSSIPKFSQTPKPFNPDCYTTSEVVLVILSSIDRTETYIFSFYREKFLSYRWSVLLSKSPTNAYFFTIVIFIGICLRYDVPTSQEENIEKDEKGNVSKLVAKYEETIAATNGSNSKPLLERLPNGSITGRNRFQTTPSQIWPENFARNEAQKISWLWTEISQFPLLTHEIL